MVGIEKPIETVPSLLCGMMNTVVADKENYREYQKRFNIRSLSYYCPRGCECLMLIDGDKCIGYQYWTFDKDFIDLKKLGIMMGDEEAYLFDLFVFQEFRGSDAPKMLTAEMQNQLSSRGIRKIYGFYFQDNIKALWWHKAFFKCQEITKVVNTRIFFLDVTGGKISLNI